MSELGAEVKDMAVPAVALDAGVANLIVLLSDAIAKYNDEESKQKLSKLRSVLQGNSGLQMFIDELLRPKVNVQSELDEEEEFEL